MSPRKDLLALVKFRLFIGRIAIFMIGCGFFAPLRGSSVLEIFTTDKGLSNNAVYAILQDQRGFLWIGTEDGLNRYDGVQFIQYRHNPDDPNSISGNDVTCLLEDRENKLWIGTWDGGLNRYDPDSDLFERFTNITGGTRNFVTRINCLHKDAEGNVWVGTKGEGLALYEPKRNRFRNFLFKKNIPRAAENQIWCLTSDSTGRLLAGTDRGILSFDPKTEVFQPLSYPDREKPVPESDPIRSLLMDQASRLWIGTNRGLFRIGPGEDDFHFFGGKDRQGLEDEIINTIFEDRRGTIWIGSGSGGLSRYIPTENSFRSFRGVSEFAPVTFGIRALQEDRTEIMWIGAKRGGLIKLDRKPQKFRSHGHDPYGGDGLSNPIVKAIMVDRRDNVWIGTEGGLDYLDRLNRKYAHYQPIPRQNGTGSGNSVSALAMDGDGRIWVGTPDGLQLFRDGLFRTFLNDPNNPDSLPHNEVTCLKTDHLDVLWIGTRNGLSRYDGKFKNFYRDTENGGAGGNRITTLCEDEHYSFWVGTEFLGFSRFDRDTDIFEDYLSNPNDRNSLSNNSVTAIHHFMGFLWIGTRGGLNRFNRETGQFHGYTIKDGLPSPTICGIKDDLRNFLWISTSDGLSRFNPMTGEFRNYNMADGLLSPQFNIGAVAQSPQGELFFGSLNGMNSFFPSLVKDNPYPPKVAITRIQVPTLGGDIKFPSGSEVRLSHKDNVIQFEFRALDFTRPGQNRYQYKMEGYDKDWIQADSQRSATYAGLAPDTYELRVKATNNDGVWSQDEATVRITIQPPFYRTPLAFFLAGSAALLLIGWTIQNYRRRERERTHKKIRFESMRLNDEINRTRRFFLSSMGHELRTPLATIIGYAELLREEVEDLSADPNPKDLVRDLAKIKSSAYYQLSLVTNLLELSSIEMGQVDIFPTKFEVDKMLEEMLTAFRPQLDSSNRFELRMNEPPGALFNDPVKVQQILMNLLLNANQVTRKGDIVLIVEKIEPASGAHPEDLGLVQFTVEDTGSGMTQRALDDLIHTSAGSARKKSGGIGLKLDLCRRLCALMNGEIEVQSEPGIGTRVRVRFPIKE